MNIEIFLEISLTFSFCLFLTKAISILYKK